MPLNENDLSYLIDIVDCIMDIKEFTESIQYYQFENDKMRKLAVERQLEVIGQAANKISKETQEILKNIPWANIIGLRNKLAHDYGEILAERIWTIAKTSVHELLKEIEKVEEIKDYIKSKRHFA
ncbi:hypothetical protein AGMMS50268_14410 [Spirochaetia bacterium]|nr:hypothetical protein AGMMS50268_14410 [Spirochaetia bacterium]